MSLYSLNFGKTIALSCLVFLGASFSQAQVTYYNSNEGSGDITHLSVAGNSNDALARMGMKTELRSGGSLSTVFATIQGVSSDGVFYGTGYDGQFKPIYLDFDGSVKFFNFDANSSIGRDGGEILSMEGGYVQTRSSSQIVETFLNGVKLAEGNYSEGPSYLASGITRSGNSIRYESVVNEKWDYNLYSNQVNLQSKLVAYDGTGILQQGRGAGDVFVNIQDLAANDRILFSWENRTLGTKGHSTYDLLSGEMVDLTTNGITPVQINNNGDMLGITSQPVRLIGFGGGTVQAYEFWYFKNGEGWFNSSEINGIAPVLSPYLLSVSLSEGGEIYGLLDQSIRVNANVSQAFKMAPVPEPGAMLLLAAGASGWIAARRKKKLA